MSDINEIAEQMLTIARIREQHSPVNNSTATMDLLKHLAEELVETTVEYARIGYTDESTKHFQDELGDILCITMLICSKFGFDIEEILNNTLAKNTERANKTGDKL